MITTLIQGPTIVSVITTSGGDTLETLLAKKGVPLDAGISRLALIPASAGIYWSPASASASTAPLPVNGIDLPIRHTEAESLKFFGSTIAMTVLQFGPKGPQG